MAHDKPRARNYIDRLLDTKMIDNADIASRLAELLITNHYGLAQMEAQRPYSVIDQEDQWVVTGSRNKDREDEGLGPAKIIIRKKDGKILDMHIPYVLHPHPDVRPILAHAQKIKR
ncbi:MAG TPA: NTF2 fold immunity protein [Alphaproteobacteria bacterium]|nr:NTF2 fold immunity protein [Alphaproteobacteria bacterium]